MSGTRLPNLNSTRARQSTEYTEHSSPEFSGICSSIQHGTEQKYDASSYELNYNFKIFKPIGHRRIIHFPKQVLTTNVPEIREFDQPQKHLYYFLTWSHKMAIIDQSFLHYSFSNQRIADIGIFNTELHDKRTNAVLFVVANLTQITPNSKGNQPLWTMNKLMTARQLFRVYGINECDLPNGSRSNRNFFSSQINSHYERLQSLVYVNDWNKIPILPNRKSLDLEDVDNFNFDLNAAIAASIEEIKKNELELIPVLTIKGRVYCDALIPIRVKTKWFAVSYKTSTIRPYKATVTGLCVDADDILNKASLVDPNAVSAYQWMLPRDDVPQLNDVESTDSLCSLQSDISYSSRNIQSLSQQLAAALHREKMLMDMMMNQTKLKSSQSMRTSFMSLPNSSSNQTSTNSFIQTPSINNMSTSRSAPITPILQSNNSYCSYPMTTPPPISLSGSIFGPPSMESSPSLGPIQGIPNMQNIAYDLDQFAMLHQK